MEKAFKIISVYLHEYYSDEIGDYREIEIENFPQIMTMREISEYAKSMVESRGQGDFFRDLDMGELEITVTDGDESGEKYIDACAWFSSREIDWATNIEVNFLVQEFVCDICKKN